MKIESRGSLKVVAAVAAEARIRHRRLAAIIYRLLDRSLDFVAYAK